MAARQISKALCFIWMLLKHLCILAWSIGGAVLLILGPQFVLQRQASQLIVYGSIWMLLNVLVLAQIIFCSGESSSTSQLRQATRANRRVILVGLIGGFAIALPALVVTTLAFATAFPHFFEALHTTGATVALTTTSISDEEDGPPKAEQGREKAHKSNAYILAVDTSGSAIRNQADSQLIRIADVVDDIFLKDQGGVLVKLVQYGDSYGFFKFAGRVRKVFAPGDSSSPSGPEVAEVFREKLFDTGGWRGVGASTTDMSNFLLEIVSKIEPLHDKYEHVTVVLFTDFWHDVNGAQRDQVEQELSEFVERVSVMGNVHFLSVVMEPYHEKGIDTRPIIAAMADRKIWREISLSDYAKVKDLQERRSILLTNLYSEQSEEAPLYLKYLPFDGKVLLPSFLQLPEKDPSYGVIQLGLRADEDGPLSRVNLRFEPQDGIPKMLGLGGRLPAFELLDHARGRMTVYLKSRLDISRSVECDLLVVVPSRALVHVVRIVILPVFGDRPFEIFRWTLLVLALMLVVLGISFLGIEIAKNEPIESVIRD
jgi:hypothetical protein